MSGQGCGCILIILGFIGIRLLGIAPGALIILGVLLILFSDD